MKEQKRNTAIITIVKIDLGFKNRYKIEFDSKYLPDIQKALIDYFNKEDTDVEFKTTKENIFKGII